VKSKISNYFIISVVSSKRHKLNVASASKLIAVDLKKEKLLGSSHVSHVSLRRDYRDDNKLAIRRIDD